MARSGATLAERIRKLQTGLIRELNDQHIFIHQALPVLTRARRNYAKSTDETDRKYFVPSQSKRGVARRTDRELKTIYDRYLDRELFATSLITAVSLTEAFVFDVLREVFRAHPYKLSISIKGKEGEPAVPLSAVVEADTVSDVIEVVIDRRLNSAAYASPTDYLKYFTSVTGIATDDGSFQAYIEIKATRDLVVHNGGVVNDVYLEKAGKAKRGKLGKPIPLGADYYDNSIACLKKLANLINDGGWATFHRGQATG